MNTKSKNALTRDEMKKIMGGHVIMPHPCQYCSEAPTIGCNGDPVNNDCTCPVGGGCTAAIIGE
jgi:hypothetical protein